MTPTQVFYYFLAVAGGVATVGVVGIGLLCALVFLRGLIAPKR